MTPHTHFFALIVGAGPGGIAMAYQLKSHGINDFLIVDRNDCLGGTWCSNRYPGCGCDVPSHLYSFSFAPSKDWSRPMALRGEVLSYLENIMTTHNLHSHAAYQMECCGARWESESSSWTVNLKNLSSDQIFVVQTRLLLLATGLFNQPSYPDIKGLRDFHGKLLHSAEWDEHFDVKGKRVAVIGSGPSAMQLIPSIAEEVKELVHFPGKARWMFFEDNRPYSRLQRWCFQHIPLLQRARRATLFWAYELDFLERMDSHLARRHRARKQKASYDYMAEKTPKAAFQYLLPGHSFGCKRRVFDVGYLDALSKSAITLESKPISCIDGSGISTTHGGHRQFDCIVLATGFDTASLQSSMRIIGDRAGEATLSEYWNYMGAPRAFNSISVAGFPNMGILFGPNGVPAHHSAIFNIEIQAKSIYRVYAKTLVQGSATKIDVRED